MNLLPEALKSMSPSELLSENERLLEVVRQQQQQIQAQQAVMASVIVSATYDHLWIVHLNY
jgi:hypothetical protein